MIDDIEMKPALFKDAYIKLHMAYLERLKNTVSAIDNILAQKQRGPLSRDTLECAMHLAHGMAGSGSTFGFPNISNHGQKIDAFLLKILKTSDSEIHMTDKNYETFEHMMIDLRDACNNGLNTDVYSGVTQTYKNGNQAMNVKNDFFVLIVDDDNNLSDLLSIRLRQKNIRVMTASDGTAALKIMRRDLPDLVVLDIVMPGMGGHDLLRHLKQNPEFVSIPVLMLTGRAQEKDVVSALHSGAINYIVKPADPDQMVGRIEKLLDASRYTVVIADNDPLILQLLDSKFKNRGFKVQLAEDGASAWNHIFKTLPDLVILDRMMPGMEGLAILQNIRKEEATKHIPVIILSARKEERDIVEGMKRGAQDYIAKPFIVEDLINKSLKILKEAEIKH